MNPVILHTVAFRLMHPEDSEQERAFLDAALSLAKLPMVREFHRLRQVGVKNDFRFGLSMQFDDQAAYDAYTRHPEHEAFVKDYWLKDVVEFMEIDYIRL